MIKSIKLKFGRAPTLQAETIETTPVTLFVGPNNSGKSKVLSEIYQFCQNGSQNTLNLIFDSLEFETFTAEQAEDKIKFSLLKPRHGEAVLDNHVIIGKKGTRHNVNRSQLLEAVKNPNNRPSHFCSWYLSYNTLILDGNSRINLINQQPAGDLQIPQSTFQVLFTDDKKRHEVRRIIKEAFDLYFVIDPTHLGQLRLRLALYAPLNDAQERGIHDESVSYHSKAMPIENSSDGVKAFTGIITEIIAGDPAVLLIDEPEAFLHPALSFKLGKEIARASHKSEKRLFISTHSTNFVMGCIQSGTPINIIRLTYRNGTATARVLPKNDILRLMRSPLLRSTGVLGGIFYEFVVVTESDSDRAFYQEINERLVLYDPDNGIPNCLFLNAQNKQTVHTIIRPLRELGIPAAGIIDLDMIKEGGSVWTNFLKGGFIPELEHSSLAQLRNSVKTKFEETGRDMKRDGGVALLSPNDQEAANNLLDQLADYGLFVVRGGELESWLPTLQSSGHGPDWLVDVFEKMGEDPDLPNYMKPVSGDVWEFIGRVKHWLTNANRKGIPT
ncbi:MAG: AAA family ATPase [Thermodesulfobacteriota bacterium]